MVRPIPEGYHTITPYLTVHGAANLISFLKNAFDAKEVHPALTAPDGTIMHAELKIGDSLVMIGETNDANKCMPCCLYLYVQDTDALFAKAMKAGGKSILDPINQFYGDRNAAIQDPCGNQWWIATHVEDVSHDEIMRRAQQRHKQATATAAG